jgi:hypothetical protein
VQIACGCAEVLSAKDNVLHVELLCTATSWAQPADSLHLQKTDHCTMSLVLFEAPGSLSAALGPLLLLHKNGSSACS